MATAYDLTSVDEPYAIKGVGFRRNRRAYGPRLGSALTTDHVGTINNTVTLFYVPRGFVITGLHIDTAQLDSNVSPTLTLDLGDATTADRLLAASTVGQAGGLINVLPAGVLGYRYTTDTAIVLTMHAANATAAAGTFVCILTGWLETDL